LNGLVREHLDENVTYIVQNEDKLALTISEVSMCARFLQSSR
jgi:hypothetical protein